MGINVCTLSGNVGQDPEIKYFESGSVMTSFSVAVSNYKQGEKHTFWMPCKAWSKTAETIAEYVRKGNPVTVSGNLDFEEWTSEGQKKSRTVLVVRDIQLPPKQQEPSY